MDRDKSFFIQAINGVQTLYITLPTLNLPTFRNNKGIMTGTSYTEPRLYPNDRQAPSLLTQFLTDCEPNPSYFSLHDVSGINPGKWSKATPLPKGHDS